MNDTNYQICDILASVPASKRSCLSERLRDLGEEEFLAISKKDHIEYAYGLDLEQAP